MSAFTCVYCYAMIAGVLVRISFAYYEWIVNLFQLSNINFRHRLWELNTFIYLFIYLFALLTRFYVWSEQNKQTCSAEPCDHDWANERKREYPVKSVASCSSPHSHAQPFHCGPLLGKGVLGVLRLSTAARNHYRSYKCPNFIALPGSLCVFP